MGGVEAMGRSDDKAGVLNRELLQINVGAVLLHSVAPSVVPPVHYCRAVNEHHRFLAQRHRSESNMIVVERKKKGEKKDILAGNSKYV